MAREAKTADDYYFYIELTNNTKDGVTPREDSMVYYFRYMPDDSRDEKKKGPYKIRPEEVTEDNILKWIENFMTWKAVR